MKTRISKCLLLVCLVTGAIASIELPYHNDATRQLLVETTKDEDRVQRIRAIRALGQVKDDRNAAEQARVAQDPVEAVRHEATAGPPKPMGEAPSGTFQPRPQISAEQATETHRDPRVRQAARLRLLESGPEYQTDFSKLIDDPDYFVRRALSTQVVKARGAASIPIWRKLLASEKLTDRVEASWAVGQLNSKEDEATLLGFVPSDSERLRLITVESLRVVGGDATRSAVGELVEKQTGKTQEALLRLAAHLQARPALPVLRALAVNKKATQEAQVLALDALRAMADAEAKPMLLKMIADYDNGRSRLREHSALALGVLEATEAVPLMKKLISEKCIPVPMIGPIYDSDSTRIACMQALEQLKANDALKSLLGMAFLDECSENLRRTLSETLTRTLGTTYDYRRMVLFREYFIQSLVPDEFPADVADNLKKPPIFAK